MASPFPIPLNALRAIEIVARRGALAPAAEELNVTPGAVSQHIRRAEERLGIDLFERTPHGLRPTLVLRNVLPQLTVGFTTLADALAAVTPRDEHVLSVTVGTVFASRWLIWRLGKFSALHPEIETRLVVTVKMVDLHQSGVDCGIRYGRGDWPGTVSELIGGTRYRPVCHPEMASRLKTPADLANVPIIHDTTTMLSWGAWLEAANTPGIALNGPTYDDPGLAFDAAISGLGVLMAVDEMAADAVSDGRLVRPFDTAVESGVGYYFLVADGRREPKRVKAMREWLRREWPDSVDGYVAQQQRARAASATA